MGLGLHGGGLATVQWLLKKKALVTVTDLKTAKQLRDTLRKLSRRNITYVLGRHRDKDFSEVDMIVKNPGVPDTSPYLALARKNKIPIETDISIFLSLLRKKDNVIGITGTKGKSTTTSLITHILRTAGKKPVMAGNIRISPLSILRSITAKTPVVLELSSWQLDDIQHMRWSPHVAVLTNVMPDHLNRYGSLTAYARSKAAIFNHQTKRDVLITNADDPIISKMTRSVKSQKVLFSIHDKTTSFVHVKNHFVYSRTSRHPLIKLDDIRFPGSHNVSNILSSVAVTLNLGIARKDIVKAILTFPGVPGRMEVVRKLGITTFYNDTTATTPDASMSAIRSLPKGIVLIAGGSDKNLPYDVFAEAVGRSADLTILLPGTATDKIVRLLRKKKSQRYRIVHDMKQAVESAWDYAKRNKTGSIVLSPGAASFGLFVHEFDRGDQFIRHVKRIKA